MFIWFSLGFVGSIFVLYQLPQPPQLSIWWLACAALILPAYYFAYYQAANFFAGIIIGVMTLVVALYFSPKIDESMTYQPVLISGQVVSLVESQAQRRGHTQRFEMRISHWQTQDGKQQQHWRLRGPKIRLSCYFCDWQAQPGQVYRLKASIKPIHGHFNPGGFDYEGWAHQRGLQASGYVRIKDMTPVQVKQAIHFQQLRARLSDYLEGVWGEQDFAQIYNALLYADRQGISAQQWDVMRATGTIHLMAISGLHMALVALMGYGVMRWLWYLPIQRFRTWPIQWFGAAGAMLFATAYGMLAGFTIPTQRAWIMVAVGVLFLLLRRKFQPWPVLMLAAVLVVAWSPSSVLAQGFWLSFLAVGLIFLWLSVHEKQTAQQTREHPWLYGVKQALIIQLILSIGLAPALWYFHQQIPLYSVLANLIAVPFVSFIGLPLLFITLLLSFILAPIFPQGFAYLLSFMDVLWSWLWAWLEFLAALPASEWSLQPINLWQMAVFYIALFAVLLAKQRAWPALIIAFLLLVAPFNTPNQVKGNSFLLTLLDVGQGQALVIETQNYTLVYDTGPAQGDRFDGTHIAIAPYLRQRNVQQIDKLIISHADLDHAGGAPRLVRDWSIGQKLSGEPQRLAQVYRLEGFKQCEAGQQWHWDGVDFEILAPGLFEVRDHNDHSCVLSVSSGEQRLMITGDLGARHERLLTYYYEPERLASEVLVAGHHGSRHSSDPRWLSALQPDLVLFPAGYRNRFAFPHDEVIERVEQQSADWLNTACEGAIQIHFSEQRWTLKRLERQYRPRWFHHSCYQVSSRQEN